VELHELPDLSDWRLIEVWSIEEAAMLWAGIDPMGFVAQIGPSAAEAQHG